MSFTKNYVQYYDSVFKEKDGSYLFKSLNKKESILYDEYLTDTNERSIARNLYDKTPSHQTFQSLKKGLFEKLISATLLVQSGNSFQRNKARLYRKITAIYILDNFGLRSIMFPLCKKVFQQCLKYHMYYECAGLSRLMSQHYMVYENDEEKAHHFNNEATRLINIYEKEVRIEWEYSKIQSLFLQRSFSSQTLNIKKIADSILSEINSSDSARIHSYYFLIRYAQYYSSSDLNGREKTCKEALEYFENLNFKHIIAKNIFTFHLINTYLEKKELAKAELITLSFLNDTDEKSHQYYRYRELLFRIHLYQGHIEKVNDSFYYLKKNIKKMENLFSKNRLLIYEIYVDFLNNRMSNFRKIHYNLNRVKNDKKGMYVPLLIGQAIQSFKFDPDKFIDKYESLNLYC